MNKDEIFEVEQKLRDSIDNRFWGIKESERVGYEDTERDLAYYKAFAAIQDLRNFLTD